MNQDGLLQEDNKKELLEVTENFGILLKYFRELRGYSLKDLESISNVSASYIFRLENGNRKAPSLPKVFALAEALKITYFKLFETAMALASQDQEETVSLQELLIQNDYVVNQKAISREVKVTLVKIFDTIAESDWNEKSKWQVMFRVGELIEEFKRLTQAN
jgi:transcriptional regulator with XRE-family HTH domain